MNKHRKRREPPTPRVRAIGINTNPFMNTTTTQAALRKGLVDFIQARRNRRGLYALMFERGETLTECVQTRRVMFGT